MPEQFDATVNLTTQVCIICGVVFTLPCNMRRVLLENHGSFYCPSGHVQQFIGKTKDEEIGDLEDENITLEEENRKLENRLTYYKNRVKKSAASK